MDALLPGMSSTTSLHPALVHFPIALWIAAAGFAAAAAVLARDDFARMARWLLYLGTLAGLAAAATGLAHAGNPPGHGPMWVHKVWMLSATGLALATCAAAFLFARRPTTRLSRWVVAGALAAVSLATTFGADRGAFLVYRYHMGSSPDPTENVESGGRGR